MRRIVCLILGSWVLAASAQFPGLPPGMLTQGVSGMPGISYGDLAELKRQSEEMASLHTEIARMKRLGRFEEAEALNRRLFEVMSTGPLGRIIGQGMRQSREMQRDPSTGLPQAGIAIENVGQIGQISAAGLRMERANMESDTAFYGKPLFVRPVMTESIELAGNQAQMPVAALELMLDGIACMNAKDYDASEQSFAKAISLSRSPTIIQAATELDIVRGQRDVALRRLQSAIDALEKEDPSSGKIASMLWRQASIHSTAGAHGRAAEVCERALAIVTARGTDTAEYAAGQNNLGVALQLGGSTARALEYYERSFAALQNGMRNTQPGSSRKYKMQIPAVAANRGLAFWQLGDPARAMDSFRVALEERAFYENESNALLTERTRLAKAQAIAIELDALITLERATNTRGLGLLMLLERKGALLEQRTRTQAAFRRNAQVQSAPPDILGRASDSQLTREQALGQRAENRAAPREQGAVAQEQAAIPSTPANAARINAANVGTLVTQLGMQKSDEERRSFLSRVFGLPDKQDQAIAEANRQLAEEQARRQRAEDQASRQRAEDQDLLREYYAVVQQRSAIPRTPANAARIADLDTRIQVMQLSMEKRNPALIQKGDPQASNSYISQEELNALQRKYANDPQGYADAWQAPVRKEQERRAESAATSAKGERAKLFSRVQASVPKDAVLVEMVRYRPLDPSPGLPDGERSAPARYGAYVIHPEGEAQYVDLGDAGPLEKLIAEFRASLADPVRATARDLGRRLDEALMRPVRTRLGNELTLYIAPEGALNLIPLGALVDEKGSYLLERYTINYLASGRDLLYLGRNNSARGPAIIFADPAFDEQAGGTPQPADGPVSRSADFRSIKFSRLPGTAAEAQTLKRILPDAAVLTGTAATETATKKLGGPRILHIATHGFFLEDLPGDSEDPMLRSGLVFAGVNALRSADDDGVLTALEASNLDLRGTKLVVLSACNTGLGEVKNGEGVFGLRRAFVVAGAETLLMSLWQVSDEATKDLMTSYYTLLARGESRSEALRQTQMAMLKNPVTAHPFFWAAFISSGETGYLK